MGNFEISNFGELGESLGLGVGPIESPTHDFLLPPNTKFCSVCCRLTAIPMSSYAPPPPNLTPLQLHWIQPHGLLRVGSYHKNRRYCQLLRLGSRIYWEHSNQHHQVYGFIDNRVPHKPNWIIILAASAKIISLARIRCWLTKLANSKPISLVSCSLL